MHQRTAYELSQSQVVTPHNVIRLFWRLVHDRRQRFGSVLDLGAGDGRFALGGRYQEYVGVEIDPHRVKTASLPLNGKLYRGCAFRHRRGGYDACIGNPPYVRHHDIESPWKEQVVERIAETLDITLNRKCNLFVYFLCLAALKSRDDGFISMIVPYEWVSRPSVEPLRAHIRKNRWQVDVYRFVDPIFPDVLTTASITIIDKKNQSGTWRFYDVDSNHDIRPRRGPTRSGSTVLQYAERGPIWAMRGLSPGAQEAFALSEGDRIHYGLSRRDVVPCVTTLRHAPPEVRTLTKCAFRRYFIELGARCWLIRSFASRRSAALDAYLAGVPVRVRRNYTCRNREPWFKFSPHPIPELLVSSGFTKFGPKAIRNLVGAHAVGAVTGVYVPRRYSLRRLQDYLLTTDFEKKIVAHAKTLKKLEVRQLNAVLNTFVDEFSQNGK